MKKLRKIITLILAALICLSYTCISNKSFAATPRPSVLAKSYVVIDRKTGEILF